MKLGGGVFRKLRNHKTTVSTNVVIVVNSQSISNAQPTTAALSVNIGMAILNISAQSLFLLVSRRAN